MATRLRKETLGSLVAEGEDQFCQTAQQGLVKVRTFYGVNHFLDALGALGRARLRWSRNGDTRQNPVDFGTRRAGDRLTANG